MSVKKSIFFCIALIIMFSCGGREKVGREATVYNDDGVYSDKTTDGMEEVDLSGDSVDYRSDRGQVDSELLDASGDGIDQLPDWSPVYFEFDKALLTAEARERLLVYGQELKNNSRWRILIEGHCDIRGTEAYNQALGERRAESVRRFLLDLGVPSSQMNTISYGELKPVLPREDEEAWALNRRAEFRIQK